MRKLFVLLATFSAVCACSPRVQTLREVEYRDRDVVRNLRDSIHTRDSIYVEVKGDTVYKFRDRLRYRDRIKTDTIVVTESVTKSVPVVVEKSLSSWQSFRLKSWPWMLTILLTSAIWSARRPILKLIRRLILKV